MTAQVSSEWSQLLLLSKLLSREIKLRFVSVSFKLEEVRHTKPCKATVRMEDLSLVTLEGKI